MLTEAQLESLVREHQTDIYRYLKYLGADTSIAQDILQEVFVTAYNGKNIPPIDDRPRIGGWLRGVARNQFLSHCRREKRSPVYANSESLEQAEAAWVANLPGDQQARDYLNALAKCLEDVSPRNREILQARHRDGMSREEMATAFDMGAEGIKTVLRRTREFLQRCIRRRVSEGATR